MATFEAQVEGLTGLAITGSTTPTQDELSQFLKDGVIDVTKKCIEMDPNEASNFQRATTSDSQGVGVGGAKIISVIREANADGSSDGSVVWRPCRRVSVGLQSRVIDEYSLHYASIYNPVYIIDNNNTINVYPVPSSNNGIKIYYVNEEPRDVTNDAALVYTHSNIKYFPSNKVYLVAIYAAIKSLEAKMGEYTIDEEDSELVQAINYSISSLRNKYENAFYSTKKQKEDQREGMVKNLYGTYEARR